MGNHITNADIERRADQILTGKSRVGAALRDAAGRRSLKIGVVTSILLGLADSTHRAAQFEQKSVGKTGVGYKAWAGAALLATGAVAGMIAEDAGSDKKFKQAEQVADVSLNLSNTLFTVEGYNLGVTRGGRVRQAVSQLTGDSSPTATQGLPGGAYRPGLPARVGGVRSSLRRGARLAQRFIDSQDPERIAEIFGIDEDTQAALFGDDDNNDDLLPAEG